MRSPAAATTKMTKSALGSKRMGNPTNMTTPTPTGNHGGLARSRLPYAHPGTAKFRTYSLNFALAAHGTFKTGLFDGKKKKKD